LASASGDARLATLGSGDVLAGIIGAFCAMGVDPFIAAAAGAHVHGRAAEAGPRHGFVAPDLLDLLPPTLDRIAGSDEIGLSP
jgi:NAD(P)H-hydrate repair Nnr-like enzyme with NAD(P)H-hydrate dehydratase domain